MDKLLRPDKLSTLHTEVDALKKWKYWRKCFENFLSSITPPTEGTLNKLALLTNFVEPDVFEYFSEETTYDAAMGVLNKLYEKPVNEIYARHMLATAKQESSETLDCFLQRLKVLSKMCQFKLPTTALLYEEEYIRDAFITGLSSQKIRERLLEEKLLSLAEAFDKARSIEVAQQHSQSYGQQMYVNSILPTVS